MENLETFYSTNNEDFTHTEFGELISVLENDDELKVGAVYYEAQFRRITIVDLVSAPRLIEDMEYRLFDIVGECANDSLTGQDAVTEALQAALAQWAEKHTRLNTFYKMVGKSREKRITEDDLPQD